MSIAMSLQQIVQGTVYDNDSGLPLNEAKISIEELGLETYTDQEGHFEFQNIALDRFTIFVERDEYLGQEIHVVNLQDPLIVLMLKNSIELSEVVVTGKEGNKNGTTSTHIKRKALEHMQATNLQEVLQLAPGGLVQNPDFSNTNQVAIRQYAPDNLGSLGTSVIINGATLSNNANLQLTSSARSGSSAGFSTSSGGGVDLRNITADNVESIEVIRGIPSVEYGDLNNGALVVKTKAHKEPLQIKSRFNPKLTQFWAGKGFELDKNKGSLFADIDYTQSYDSETNKYQKYQRLTGSLQHTYISNSTNKWTLNSTLSVGYAKDSYDMDPDYVSDSVRTKSTDKYIRFVNNGSFDTNALFSRNINYTLSVNYAEQRGYQQQYYNADITAESYALENSTNEVPYLPSAYLSRMWVEGNPLNIHARINNKFYLSFGNFNHAILMGAEWKMDANYGSGKTFTRPPRNTSGAAYRERSYKSIPAMHQIGAFLQDKLTGHIKGSKLSITAGLRLDMIQPFEGNYTLNAVSPRINTFYELPIGLTLRGGYGITVKAPTLQYLYPGNAYFDFYSLNYYSSDPDERLALISTRVYPTANYDLKLSKTNKYELGTDIQLHAVRNDRLSLTGYYENTANGYSIATGLNAVKLANYPLYTVSEAPDGEPPILDDEVENRTRFVSYYAPTNNINRINKGIEFDLSLEEFKTINTSFKFNGAFTYTKSVNNDPYILQNNLADRETTRIGVFNSGRGSVNQRFVTTLRAIHHIPEVGFIVTLSAQTTWMDKDKYVGYNSLPIGYIPINTEETNPQIIYLTEQEIQAIDPNADADIYLPINEAYHIEEKWDPLWLFNIRLTKEFKGGLNFSFFANNFINHRPLQTSTRYPNTYYKRNIGFFFGSEISIKL
nr:TonB-dependent receptor plug domain-containing protein [uncultured Allomuricauda sp.]